MELVGKLIQILEEQSGQSKTGNAWRKQEFVIETKDAYPKKVCMNLWGDKIDQLKKIAVGTDIKAFFDIESREYNGKWYTDVKAWKLELADSNQNNNANQDYNATQEKTPPQTFDNMSFSTDADENDLPF
jgi:hypothetical protein